MNLKVMSMNNFHKSKTKLKELKFILKCVSPNNFIISSSRFIRIESCFSHPCSRWNVKQGRSRMLQEAYLSQTETHSKSGESWQTLRMEHFAYVKFITMGNKTWAQWSVWLGGLKCIPIRMALPFLPLFIQMHTVSTTVQPAGSRIPYLAIQFSRSCRVSSHLHQTFKFVLFLSHIRYIGDTGIWRHKGYLITIPVFFFKISGDFYYSFNVFS